MTDTNQKLREALQAYQDANEMSPYGDYSKIEWESGAGPVNPSWGGGDCKKHGRWYGRCYSCSDEWDNLRKSADRDAYTARENALNAAKQMARQALALPTADHIPDAGKMIETAAPDMPLSMNQFGRLVELTREHLTDNTFVYKATSKAGDTCHFGVESAAKAWAKGGTVEAIKVREFKLHTSSPTAAPVGERELPPLPSCARWEERIKTLMQQCGHPNSKSIYQAFKQFQNEFEHEMIAYARAALSAGDAVDGPLIDAGSKPALSPLSDKEAIALIEEHTNDDNVLHAHEAIELIRSVERAHGIDAAMRKGQL